jgi:DNA helicase-2/ATP-dependent DNA helicase PcrA
VDVDFLETLNKEQLSAVTAGPGAKLVIAGPGSGKTRVLTHRIAYLIGTLGLRPYQLLAVTFTNKAAREMKHRVENLIDSQIRGLTLGTFHSVCVRILRREAKHLPFESNFVIFDADDQLRVVKGVLKELNIDDKVYRPASVHGAISRAKNEMHLPETFPINHYRDEVVRRVYEKYQELLLASNALDFDDLLLWTYLLLDQVPQVREKYSKRYEHVLVDEFQDTNMVQYELLKHLASYHGNIFVVGDIDQSIYRWRGADYRNIQRYEENFPGAEVILLEQNYRSTQRILDVATAVIERNPNRKKKDLLGQRGQGQKIIRYEAMSDMYEAQYITEIIERRVANQANTPSDFAIMYRTNAQSRVLEEAFLRSKIPYKLVGAQRFYGRREVKDIVAYMRLVYNLPDEISLQRVINTPSRKIGAKTLTELRTQAVRMGLSSGAMLLELAKGSNTEFAALFSGRAYKALAAFGVQLTGWLKTAQDEPAPLKLMDQIIEDTDYYNYINDGSDEGEGRWENVMELRRLAADYEERGVGPFLEEIALVSDQDTVDSSAESVTLLTLHAAKGLEYPIVFLVGLEDGTLPHSRSFDDPEGMAEERRLLYVGITRAKDELYLISAMTRMAYGFTEDMEPSRFLNDVPLDLLAETGYNRSRSSSVSRREYRTEAKSRWGSASGKPKKKIVKKEYPVGTRVRHPVWEDGMILNSKIEDGDEVVDVFFGTVGKKRLIASLAKLEKI